MRSQAFFALAAGLATTTAHTIFVQLESGGTTYDVSYGIRDPSYDGPITDVTSDDLACNGGPNPTTASPCQLYVPYLLATFLSLRSLSHLLYNGAHITCADDVIDSSHLGPTLAYLKKVDDATTDTGIGDGWFKIYEYGYTNGVWGTTNVINNAGEQEIPIPDCIEDGEYLLRAEMIALHAASSSQGAQLYMECAQISISGGKGTVSPTTYSIPGIYSATDPGLLINIYSMTSSSTYTIPGPEVFTCAA
ncbi:endoglucanase ii [Seiridium cupressi]